MEQVIALLEKRIAALEVEVLPDDHDPTKYTPVLDCLMEAHGMIGSAISCRESVASILKYLPQINDLLDPSNECEDTAEEKQYILDLFPELKDGISMIQQFINLRDVLDSEYFYSILDLSDRLDKLTISAVNTHDDSEKVMQKIVDDFECLQEVMGSFKALFAQLEGHMTAVEESAKPKQSIDE